MTHRREFFSTVGTFGLGSLMGALLAVPGVRFLLSPLGIAADRGEFQPLARLSDLKVGAPKLVPILGDRTDAWVKYPKEPVGAVWLVRQPEGAAEPVIAYTAQCPHAGCPIDLAADGCKFRCPCHNSTFTFEGERQNAVSPRGMDRLDVQPIVAGQSDAEVLVKFQRFVLGGKERRPLV